MAPEVRPLISVHHAVQATSTRTPAFAIGRRDASGAARSFAEQSRAALFDSSQGILLSGVSTPPPARSLLNAPLMT
jgi:hypothetical protein